MFLDGLRARRPEKQANYAFPAVLFQITKANGRIIYKNPSNSI